MQVGNGVFWRPSTCVEVRLPAHPPLVLLVQIGPRWTAHAIPKQGHGIGQTLGGQQGVGLELKSFQDLLPLYDG
jgi:hypothetical protein